MEHKKSLLITGIIALSSLFLPISFLMIIGSWWRLFDEKDLIFIFPVLISLILILNIILSFVAIKKDSGKLFSKKMKLLYIIINIVTIIITITLVISNGGISIFPL